MKNTALVFISLIVGTLASPAIPAIYAASEQDVARNERIVTGQIIEAIENIAREIQARGYDPMLRSLEAAYELPVPVLFSAQAIVDLFEFTGLSNIVVQSMNFSLLQSRLTFNIVLPALTVSAGGINGNAVVFGKDYNAFISGRVRISEIRLVGDIRVNIGVISGISIRSLALQFSIRGIESGVNFRWFGKDLSSWINNLLGVRIPQTMNQHAREINQLLDIVVLRMANDALENRSLFKF